MSNSLAKVLGPGGGGAMYAPQFSPTNPLLMFLACDGSGLYRTDDGGTSWQLCDGHFVLGYGVYSGPGVPTLGFSVAFHPTDAKQLVGARQYQGLKISSDGGVTWNPFPQIVGEPAALAGGGQVTAAAYDESGRLAVAVYDPDNGYSQLHVLDQSSVPPKWISGTHLSNRFVSRLVRGANKTGQPLFFAAISSPSKDDARHPDQYQDDIQGFDGAAWSSVATPTMGFPSWAKYAVLSLASATDGAGMPGFSVLATVDSDPLGKHSCALLKFDGARWMNMDTPPPLAGSQFQYYEHVAVLPSDAQTIYLTGFQRDAGDFLQPSVWVRTPASNGWVGNYYGDPNFQGGDVAPNVHPEGWNEMEMGWGEGGPAVGFTIDPTNPQRAIFCNMAVVHYSENALAIGGGVAGKPVVSTATWRQLYTTPMWTSIGLEVTTTWDYFVSGGNQFILYSDIGLARGTIMGGVLNWAWAAKDACGKPWNTWYQIIETGPGALAAAVSELHDLPTNDQDTMTTAWQKNLHGGAVLTSGDNGNSWQNPQATDKPLPGGLPITSVAYGRVQGLKDSAGNVVSGPVLLAAVWDEASPGKGGVYYSQDLGMHWSDTHLPGVTAPARCYRVLFDALEGLYCVVSMPGGSLYKWNDLGAFVRMTGIDKFVQDQFGGMAFFHPVDLTTRLVQKAGGDPAVVELYLGTIGVKGGNLAKVIKFDGSTWSDIQAPQPFDHGGPYPSYFGAYFSDAFVYITSNGHGTWYAPVAEVDGINNPTPNWSELDLPFLRTQRLTYSPTDKSLYVSTFGYGMMQAGSPAVPSNT